MCKAIMVLMIMSIAGTAIAQDLGNSKKRPVKNTPTRTYTPPAEVREGGDTVYDATVISGLPYSNTGLTCSYNDDYDEACPFTGSTSSDVVYRFTAASHILIDVDLLDSEYDTKTYIYDENLVPIACNDDFYPGYRSRIVGAPLAAGATYFIVIDGFGGDCGFYELNVTGYAPPFDPCDCDLNGDGVVNLIDIGIFASDFYDVIYWPRSDFNGDGDVNLIDLPLLAQAIGTSGC